MAEAAATDKHGKFGARRTSSRGLVFFLDAEPVRVWFRVVYSSHKHALSAYHVLKCILVSGDTGLKDFFLFSEELLVEWGRQIQSLTDMLQ